MSKYKEEFAGWWGNDIFYVDYDHGGASATGENDIGRPAKYLQTAIDAATTNATIYIRPRDFDTEDPRQITPLAAENFHIDAAKTNMSIIGTGKGLGHAAAHKTWIGGYSGLTTPVLSIYAPGCVIENLRAQPPASAANGIFYSINNATYDGGNTTFINNDFHDANSTGGINLCSTWQMSIVGNRFVNCDKGIYVTTTYCVPQIFQMWDNTFTVTTAEVLADFHTLGGVKRFLAYNNYHTAAQPTGGAPNKYYGFTVASTGAIMNCFFGTVASTADTTLFDLQGVLQAGNYSMKGLVVQS